MSTDLNYVARLDTTQIMSGIAEIRSQVYPNGGSSMRDSMDRVEVTLNQHLADPEAHHRMHGAA